MVVMVLREQLKPEQIAMAELGLRGVYPNGRIETGASNINYISTIKSQPKISQKPIEVLV